MSHHTQALLRITRRMPGIELFWLAPHSPQRARRILSEMRSKLNELSVIIEYGSEAERKTAEECCARLSSFFNADRMTPVNIPAPDFCDDS